MKQKKFKNKKGMPLRLFLIVIISLISVFTVVVTAISLTLRFTSTLENEAKTSSEQIIEQLSSTMENHVEDMTHYIDLLCSSATEDKNTQFFESTAQTLAGAVSDLSAVIVYNTDGEIIYVSSTHTLKENIENNLSDFSSFVEGDKVFISPPHVQNIFNEYYPWVVTVMKKMDSSIFGSAYISMEMTFSALAAAVDNVGIGNRGYCFILQDDEIVYHPQQQLIHAGIKSEDIQKLKNLTDGSHISDGRIYVKKSLVNSDWSVIGISFTDELIRVRQNEVIIFVSIVALGIILISIITSIIVSHMVEKPATKLVAAMHKFEKDITNYIEVDRGGISELNSISESFMHMESIINQLVEQVKREESELGKAEIRALRAQINPHFLYNTLESILWMCTQGRNDEAADMISALGKLFRLSVTPNEFNTVTEEFEHAENYLKIQKVRYENKFDYKFEVADDTKKLFCNKLLIQPFLENAIIHGLDKESDDKLMLLIRAECYNGKLIIRIKDNGIGMDEVKLERINNDIYDSKRGIGISNVMHRIKLLYGEGYGVKLSSEQDVGTEVVITLPIKEIQ